MFKIDVGSAAASLPAPAAAGTPGFFTDGDPVAGTPGTIVTADFMNMTMMELLNLVAAGGLTPSKTTYTQVRDAVLALTTAQSGNVSGIIQYSTTATLNPADAGKVVILGGGSNYTATLPSGASMPTNGTYYLFAQGAKINIQSVGSDVISIGSATGGGAVTSFSLSGSDFCTLVWRTGVGWFVISGAPLFAQFGGSFSGSIGTSGYQKLPSGLIIQWGSVSITAGANTAQSVTLPIAFPTAIRAVYGSSGSLSSYGGASNPGGTTAINVFASNNGAVVFYIALGN